MKRVLETIIGQQEHQVHLKVISQTSNYVATSLPKQSHFNYLI